MVNFIKALGLVWVLVMPLIGLGASDECDWAGIVADLQQLGPAQTQQIREIFERIRRAEASKIVIGFEEDGLLTVALARLPKEIVLSDLLPTRYVLAVLASWEGQGKAGHRLTSPERQALREWWYRHLSEVTEETDFPALERLVGSEELGKFYADILGDARWRSVDRLQHVYELDVLKPEGEWVMGEDGFVQLPGVGPTRINKGKRLIRIGSNGSRLDIPVTVLMNAMVNEGAQHRDQMNHILGVVGPLVATFYPQQLLDGVDHLQSHVADGAKLRIWAHRQLSRAERAKRNITPHADSALHQMVTQVLEQHPEALSAYGTSNGYRCSECHNPIADEYLAYLPTGDLYAHEHCASEASLKGSPHRVHRVPVELTQPAELVRWLTQYGDGISYELIRQLVRGDVSSSGQRVIRGSSYVTGLREALRLGDDVSVDVLARVVQDNRARWYLTLAILSTRTDLTDEDLDVVVQTQRLQYGSRVKPGMTRAQLYFEVDVAVMRGAYPEAAKWVLWDLQNLPTAEIGYNETTFAQVMSQLLRMGGPGIQQWVAQRLDQAEQNPRLGQVVQAFRKIQVIQKATSENFQQAEHRWFGLAEVEAAVKADMLLTEVGVRGSRFNEYLGHIPTAQHDAVWARLDERTNLRVFLDLAREQNLEQFLLENARAESFVRIQVEDNGKTYYIQATTTTQIQYALVMGTNPSRFTDQGTDVMINGNTLRVDVNRPVEQVSWNDEGVYIDRYNALKPKHKVRRTTEAEWEKAARAGTTTEYSFGGDPDMLRHYGVFGRTNKEGTDRVASLRSNAYGFYDMHGNVWEWMEDLYDRAGSSRVLRGGSFWYFAGPCHSAARDGGHPDDAWITHGFRLAWTN